VQVAKGTLAIECVRDEMQNWAFIVVMIGPYSSLLRRMSISEDQFQNNKK